MITLNIMELKKGVFHSRYRKIPKFSDARKLCCNFTKIQGKRPNFWVFCQNDVNGIANSEDPDQTAPSAV